ncbi:unnamed protein product [Cuscuta epithymum]|uniref:RING-type domain-containing protein n=1 Tax=Cuscuta epithymum TaxID=186058 RepID=A0AAV0DZL5_9ASTE|nr:unnamed protein product [Cuscuta epithymum]
MRSVIRLYSTTHKLISTFFTVWLPRGLKIIFLTLIVVSTVGERVITTTDYKYKTMIKKRTSRFVYKSQNITTKDYFVSSSRGTTPLECAICITEFIDGEVGTKLESCGHKFHAICVGKWLQWHHKKWHVGCPLCRIPVVKESDVVIMNEHRQQFQRKARRIISEELEEELGLLLLSGLCYSNFCASSPLRS